MRVSPGVVFHPGSVLEGPPGPKVASGVRKLRKAENAAKQICEETPSNPPHPSSTPGEIDEAGENKTLFFLLRLQLAFISTDLCH